MATSTNPRTAFISESKAPAVNAGELFEPRRSSSDGPRGESKEPEDSSFCFPLTRFWSRRVSEGAGKAKESMVSKKDTNREDSNDAHENKEDYTNEAKLIEMGFDPLAVKEALAVSDGDMNRAAVYLTHREPSVDYSINEENVEEKNLNDNVITLVEMGFSVEAAAAALISHNGNLNLATHSLTQAYSSNLTRFLEAHPKEDEKDTDTKQRFPGETLDAFLELRRRTLAELVKTVKIKKEIMRTVEGKKAQEEASSPEFAWKVGTVGLSKETIASVSSSKFKSLVYQKLATKDMLSFLFSMSENLTVKVQNALARCDEDASLMPAAAQLTRMFADYFNEELKGCRLEDINMRPLLERDECLALALQVAEEAGNCADIKAWNNSRHMFFPLIIVLFWMGRASSCEEDNVRTDALGLLNGVLLGTYIRDLYRARATEPSMVTIARGMKAVLVGRNPECDLVKLVSKWMQLRNQHKFAFM